MARERGKAAAYVDLALAQAVHERPRPVKEFAWQTGYAAFTVSESREEAVREYILQQKKHHRKTTFEEELKAAGSAS
jgi:REP element-mobilizing transposase RayT